MPKLVCLFWVPGSAGDMIQQLLISSKKFSNELLPQLNQQGRAVPKIDPFIRQQFPVVAGTGWHNRTWSEQDIEKLETISNASAKPYIIGTHRKDQYNLITTSIPDCLGIGISYSKSLYPAVIKNWCKKASTTSPEATEIYQRIHPVLSKKFMDKGLFPEFMLSEILNHVDNIPKEVLPEFDVSIDLGKILNFDLSMLSDFVSDSSFDFFKTWYDLQDPLYKYKFECSADYVSALGYNFEATNTYNLPIELSSLDHLLISHFCKLNKRQLPKQKFTNHIEASIFLNQRESV